MSTSDLPIHFEIEGQHWVPENGSILQAEMIDPDLHRFPSWMITLKLPLLPLVLAHGDELVVNAAFLHPLTAVDATRMDPGETRPFGHLTETGNNDLSKRDLLLWLLHSGVVNTWWHIGSELSLIREEKNSQRYEAEVVGEHEYYTNDRYTGKVHFVFRVDADGSLYIRNEEKPQA
ncbi:MAG: hypothetical protein QF752_07215 [Planctomycetota bacterium]|nr:hypothetical protein [Planctomycetota bacterium]